MHCSKERIGGKALVKATNEEEKTPSGEESTGNESRQRALNIDIHKAAALLITCKCNNILQVTTQEILRRDISVCVIQSLMYTLKVRLTQT